MRTVLRPRAVLASLAVVLALVAGFLLLHGGDAPRPEPAAARPEPPDPGTEPGPGAHLGRWRAAASVTREDSYYPAKGDPGVDMLHHDLTLAWDPSTRTLTGHDVLVFRATADAGTFRLDLGRPLRVGRVSVDGEVATSSHPGKDLVVRHRVERDHVYRLSVRYAGTPVPVHAPTTRRDFEDLGFTITADGEAWTMQEPFGAFTWLPVNDQPADKAFYDLTITAPAPMVGVSNGTMTSRRTRAGRTTTTWHNAEPMAAYLLTIGIGDYLQETDRTSSGVPLSYWVLPDQRRFLPRLRASRAALEWVESKLGPYPFDTAGVLLNDSTSGMETQTLLSLGGTDYATSARVLVHEFVHQWYGDLTGPTDWRDVWMNEGMAMYLQSVFEAEHGGPPLDTQVRRWESIDGLLRAQSGPPGSYERGTFGEGNIYYVPALMWDRLRHRIGDRAFWSMVRAWPHVHAGSTATRTDYLAWIEDRTGKELTAFFDAWLNDTATPQ